MRNHPHSAGKIVLPILLVLSTIASSGWFLLANPDDSDLRAGLSVAHVLSLSKNGEIVGEGGAFCFREDGYLVTRYHYVMNAESVAVLFPGREELEGKVIAGDLFSDLAVIKVDAPEPVPALSLVDQPSFAIGERVTAFGVRGWQRTEVAGGTILAADGRRLGIAEYEPFIIADAEGDIGYGGGPLLNAAGEVLGIIASTRGNSRFDHAQQRRFYALPAAETAAIVGRLLTGTGKLWTRPPFKGYTIPSHQLELAGVPYESLVMVRAADEEHGAMFRKGDLVTELDGMPMDGTDFWFRRMITAPAGSVLRAKVLRASPGSNFARALRELDKADQLEIEIEITPATAGQITRACAECDRAITPIGSFAGRAAARWKALDDPNPPEAVVAAQRAVAELLTFDPVLDRVRIRGSAICFRADGFFLTAAHLVPEHLDSTLRLPGYGEFDVVVVARDPRTDLAVVKIDAPSPLPTIPMVDLPEADRGQRVWAVGMAGDSGPLAVVGHVFGHNMRSVFRGMSFQDFVIADNAIREGFSGGPLLDAAGRLLGIVVGENGGEMHDPDQVARTYAFRATTAAAIVGRYLADHTPIWTDIGIGKGGSASSVTFVGSRDGDRKDLGAAVCCSKTNPFGLRLGDTILAVNGIRVDQTEQWYRPILMAPAGSRLVLLVRRRNDEATSGPRGSGATTHEVEIVVEVDESQAGSITRPCAMCEVVLESTGTKRP